jgi:hypothetical protein
MANAQNLKPPTTEQAIQRGKKGGIASGKSRQNKIKRQDIINTILGSPAPHKFVAQLQEAFGVDGDINVFQACVLKQIEKALIEGDTQALDKLVDRVDGKPSTHNNLDISGEPAPTKIIFLS